MRHITLPVAQIEFYEGQQTLWIHAPDGTTMLRIKCMGKINIDDACTGLVAHGDIIVQGDINICLP